MGLQIGSFDFFASRPNSAVVVNGEASTAWAVGDIVKEDIGGTDAAGEFIIAGADDPGGVLGMALEVTAAGASGKVLFFGYTTAKDLAAFSDGDILAPDASGGLTAANADQERRVAQVIDASEDQLFFNGYSI